MKHFVLYIWDYGSVINTILPIARGHTNIYSSSVL